MPRNTLTSTVRARIPENIRKKMDIYGEIELKRDSEIIREALKFFLQNYSTKIHKRDCLCRNTKRKFHAKINSSKLHILMISHGMNQIELARKAGLSRQAISAWLTTGKNISPASLMKLANALECKVEDISDFSADMA